MSFPYKAFGVVAVCLLGMYGCYSMIPDPVYQSKIATLTHSENFTSAEHADSPDCISLNTKTTVDRNGYDVIVGVFDRYGDRAVCGQVSKITTEDGKKFALYWNRFSDDIQSRVRDISEGSVACYEDGKCYTTAHRRRAIAE